jgi:hypothetical protein
MGLFDWFSSVTPGGAAAEVAGGVASGLLKGVGDLITVIRNEIPPEKLAEFDIKVAEMRLQALQNTLQDTQSARAMQMATKSFWPGILSFTVIVGFAGMTFYLIRFGMPDLSQAGMEALIMMFGTLNMAVGMVLQFWLGSSQGSQKKDMLLFDSRPAEKGNGS